MVNNASRGQVLLAIAAVLASVRFGLFPLIEWQDDWRENLVVLTNRLDRSVGVVANRDAIVKSEAALEAANAKLRARFPKSEDADAFRLEAQKSITDLIVSQGATVSMFDWILDGEESRSGLRYARARIQAQGGNRALARALARMEGNYPNAVLLDVLGNSQIPAYGPTDGGTGVTLVADFYFRLDTAK